MRYKTKLQILIILFSIHCFHLFSQEISTVAQIYDFEVGDIYHYCENESYGGGQSGFWRDINDVVTDKYYSSYYDTVFYVINRNTAEISEWNQYWFYDTTTIIRHMTGLTSPIYGGNIDTVFSDPNAYNGRIINYKEYYTPGQYDVDSTIHIKKWVVGCGLGLSFYEDIPWWSDREFILKYYKKGDEEWGTPVIIVNINEHSDKNPDILIYPNPMINEFNIDLRSCNITFDRFELYSLNGDLLMSQKIESGQINQITIPSIKKGLYIIELISEHEIYSRKLIKN